MLLHGTMDTRTRWGDSRRERERGIGPAHLPTPDSLRTQGRSTFAIVSSMEMKRLKQLVPRLLTSLLHIAWTMTTLSTFLPWRPRGTSGHHVSLVLLSSVLSGSMGILDFSF